MADVYSFKEIFYTIQGEGHHSGRPAVFCRFSGCNLWSGLEKDRETAICRFCDTDFWGTDGQNGGKYSANELISIIKKLWPTDDQIFIVLTGGEPALQVNDSLISALHAENIYVAIETNGTLELPKKIDWVCVSPKQRADLLLVKGNELKLVYPQNNILPEQYKDLEFEHWYLQPEDGEHSVVNTMLTIDYCLKNPNWKISIQSHKVLGIA